MNANIPTDQDSAIAKLKDPQTQKALKGIFDELGLEFEKLAESREAIKDILNAAEAKLGVKKQLIRKAAMMHFKRDASKFTAETSAVKDLYTIVASA